MRTKTLLLSLVMGAIFTGCGSSDSDSDKTPTVNLPDGKTLLFYNKNSNAHYSYDTEHEKAVNLNADSTSNLSMTGKGEGAFLYWPDEYAEGMIDEKIVMLKSTYNHTTDGNITSDNFIYLAHPHGEEFAAHSSDEFKEEALSDKKRAALTRLNTYLALRQDQAQEISEALTALDGTETLCNFLVPHHEEHSDEHNESAHAHSEKTPHYALSATGKLYIFEEDNESLKSIQAPVVLEGVSTCAQDMSGLTAYGEAGVLVFMESTQTLYLVDAHGLDYHQHSKWTLSEFMPADFSATSMSGIGESEDHEH